MPCLEPGEPGQVRNALKQLLYSFGPIQHPVNTEGLRTNSEAEGVAQLVGVLT